MAKTLPEEPQLSPAWKKAHAAAGQAMLGQELVLLRTLRKSVADASRALPATERKTRVRSVVAIRRAKAELEAELEQQILDGRLGARELGLRALNQQVSLLKTNLAAEGFGQDQMPKAARVSEALSDPFQALRSAASLATAWAAAALGVVIADGKQGKGERGSTRNRARARPEETIDHRTRRVATTETAGAFSAEQNSGMKDIRARSAGAGWLPFVFKLWNTSLDRVCDICIEHTGEMVPMGMDFKNGHEPGLVHPNCRCYPTLVFIPAAY